MMAANQTKTSYDLAVVGAGLSGLTMALAAAARGLSVALVDRVKLEKMALPTFDGRTTALNISSVALYRQLGVWSHLAAYAAPIEQIRITDNHAPQVIDFISREVPAVRDAGLAMGYIIENRHFRQVLQQQVLAEKRITVLPPAGLEALVQHDGQVMLTLTRLADGAAQPVSARLVVGADGRGSRTRALLGIATHDVDYRQSALTFPVRHAQPHGNVAAEIFTPHGPLATLPMVGQGKDNGHISSIVWTRPTKAANVLMAMDEALMLAVLEESCAGWLGGLELAANRSCYPLSLQVVDEYARGQVCLIADAAHGIHPIAGQGLNLGLQDVAGLDALIAEQLAVGLDIGSAEMLKRYQTQRRSQNRAMIAATHGLNALYGVRHPVVSAARRTGMAAVQGLTLLKHGFIKRAAGL